MAHLMSLDEYFQSKWLRLYIWLAYRTGWFLIALGFFEAAWGVCGTFTQDGPVRAVSFGTTGRIGTLLMMLLPLAHLSLLGLFTLLSAQLLNFAYGWDDEPGWLLKRGPRVLYATLPVSGIVIAHVFERFFHYHGSLTAFDAFLALIVLPGAKTLAPVLLTLMLARLIGHALPIIAESKATA